MNTIQETNSPDQPPQGGSLGLNDILRILFKHKWKLIFFSLLGIGAAVTVFVMHKPIYQSQAKILVRYVVDRSNVDSTDDRARRPDSAEAELNAEMEILGSWDLAVAVASAVTPEEMVKGTGMPAEPNAAARVFAEGLEIYPTRNSRTITLSFKHPDPATANKALNSLVTLYLDKHNEIHRGRKSDVTLQRRKSALTSQLQKLDGEIQALKDANSIVSLQESADALNSRQRELEVEVLRADLDATEQRARIEQMKSMGLLTGGKSGQKPEESKPVSEEPPPTPPAAAPDQGNLIQYQTIVRQIARLQDEQVRLLEQYSPTSSAVKSNAKRLKEFEDERRRIERDNPKLFAVVPAPTSGQAFATLDPSTELVRLATMQARAEMLRKRQEALKGEVKQWAKVSQQLERLENEKADLDVVWKKFATDFKRSEFDSQLLPSDFDNINVIEQATPPILTIVDLKKLMGGLAFGGIALGLGIVFLKELVLNRSVQRPMELETRLGIPLMLSIPQVPKNRRKQLQEGKPKPDDGKEGTVVAVGTEPWSDAHFIRPYASEIRDRLVLYFEQIGLTRKPKLVGVTAQSRGSGVSTLSSGLAAALSETGDGKVLLVDMNCARAEVHPFFDGKPMVNLMEALKSGKATESPKENLFLASAANPNTAGAQLFPKRFYEMIPTFQACDFDYIIFDMPPMNESSLTLAMSSFMDRLLMVVESDKDSRDAIRRSCVELTQAKAKIAGVFNKAREYGPKWLREA